MNVRPASEGDIAGAAALHASEISDGFLATLGPTFLRLLYRRIVRWDHSFLLVCRDQGGLVGMAAGAEDVARLYRAFLICDGLGAGIAAAPRLLRSWRQVFETLRYPAARADLPRAELLSVAVAPGARNQGLGRQLVAAVNEEFRRRGVADAKVVVGSANQTALSLYTSAGFRTRTTIEVHGGSRSDVLTWA